MAFALALAALVLAWKLLLPPFTGGVDGQAYKDPGVNLAQGRGLTAILTYGNPTLEPRLFAGYPPGFPLLYGGFAGLSGVSPEADSLFDLLGTALLLLLAFVLLRRPFRGRDPWGEALLAALLLLAFPARFVLLTGDRPDVIGLAVGLLALLPLPRSPGAVVLSALLAGTAFIISPICGVLAAAAIALLWSATTAPLPFWSTAGLGFLGFVLPVALVLAVCSMIDATYLGRLGDYAGSSGAEDAAGLTTGGGTFIALLQGDLRGWWQQFYTHGLTTPHAWARTGQLAVALPVAALLLVRARKRLPAAGLPLALAFLAGMALLSLAVVPWNKFYPAIAAAMILCAVARALPREAWAARAPRRLMLGGLAVMVALQLPLSALSLYAQAGMGQSYARIRAVVAGLDLSDRTGDGRVLVQLDSFAYFLFKPRNAVLVPMAHPVAQDPAILGATDYVVLAYPGSGDPLQPYHPPWWAAMAPALQLLYRPALPQQPRLFGRVLSNSSQTWEVEIWGRVAR